MGITKENKNNSSKTILAVVRGTKNMLFADILENMESVVAGSEYALNISFLDEDANEVVEAIKLVEEKCPEGVLFLGGNPEHFREEFEKITIPAVLVTNRADSLGFDNLGSVAIDDVAASEQAVDYLVSNGHRRIGVLGGDYSTSHTSNERFTGYANSIEKHGIKPNPAYYEKARFSYKSAYEAMTRILERRVSITAVFAMSDVMAIGGIRAIRDKGLKVPDDISVIGFDGTNHANYYNPQIVTIRQDSVLMAERSINILLNMISGKSGAVHELVPFELINKESVRKLM